MSLVIRSRLILFVWWIFAPILTALLLNSLVILILDKDYSKDINTNDTGFNYTKNIPLFLHLRSQERPKSTAIEPSYRLGDMQLKACYVGSIRQFIVFQEGGKTHFLDLHKSYKNAKLKKIGMNYALFVKNKKEIRLELQKTKTGETIGKKRNIVKKIAPNSRFVDIKRDSFREYKRSIRRALRDIRIEPLRKNREFLGVKIGFIRKNSLFDTMGFKKGDIIKSIDGHMLTSIMDLLPYYNRLDETTTIIVGFERDNEMKEITYEID